MLVTLLKESNKELKLFRSEVVEKVELCEGICRILLKDDEGDYIYCLLQGIQWFEKTKDVNIGQKVILGPSKIVEVPKRYKKFYTPEIKGKNVSNLFFHYNVHDFDLNIRIDTSIKKQPENFHNLEVVKKQMFAKESVKCCISAVIIDFYMKKSDFNTLENYYRLKIVDESIEISESINLNLYIRKIYSLKHVSIGDIIVVQNVSFKKKGNSIYGVHNRSFGSFGLFSWSDGHLTFCTEDFSQSECISTSVCRLQNWIFTHLQYSNLSTSHTVHSISSGPTSIALIDIVLYLIQILYDYPELETSTMVFGDPNKLGYLSSDSSLLSHIKVNSWVKLSQVRLINHRIELTESSSIVNMPDWSNLVKALPSPTSYGIKQVLLEFSRIIGKDSYVSIFTKHSQERFMEHAELINPSILSTFVRIKVVVIDFHPRNTGLGICKKDNRYVYTGIIKAYMQSDIVTILVGKASSVLFYRLNEYDSYSDILGKVEKVQQNLSKGYGWVELGIKRVVREGKVILTLSETEIKNYDSTYTTLWM